MNMLPRGFAKNLDRGLIAAAILLTAIGLAALYTMAAGGEAVPMRYFRQQCLWSIGSVFAGAICLSLNYQLWKRFSLYLFIINTILLLLLLFFGKKTSGAESWFAIGQVKFQPSELAKILFILTFATYLSDHYREINRISTLLTASAHFLIPFALIIAQPDMGTAMVLAAIFFGMLFVSGVNGIVIITTLSASVSAGIIAAPLILKDYQLRRITSFLKPEGDPLGAGYQLIQSKIAIGSGGLFGKGLFHTPQTSHGFLPAAFSDFVFAGVCEQVGFIGAVVVLLLYVYILFRIFRIASEAEDLFALYIAAGVFSMLAFQSVINIGMTAGLLPITGIPLPFISYGGSSLISNFVAVALLLNISIRKRKIMFG